MEPTLAVGVLATSPKLVGELSRLARGAGFSIAASLDVAAVGEGTLPQVDAWLVSMDLHDEVAQGLLEQLESCGTPVIYDDDSCGANGPTDTADAALLREQRVRRLAAKLQQVIRDSANRDAGPVAVNTLARAQNLWVVAASTGGPDAVTQFSLWLRSRVPQSTRAPPGADCDRPPELFGASAGARARPLDRQF